MGKIGDISGKIGDISGKIGDISGDSPFEEVKDFLLQDREADRLGCLELKVRRLQNEMVVITAWLDARITALEQGSTDLEDDLKEHDQRLGIFEDLKIKKCLEDIVARLEALEPEPEPKRKSPNGPKA